MGCPPVFRQARGVRPIPRRIVGAIPTAPVGPSARLKVGPLPVLHAMPPLSLRCPALRWPMLVLAIAAACAGPAWALPTFDAVRREFRPSDTEVLDRDGAVLQRVRTDATVRRGQW